MRRFHASPAHITSVYRIVSVVPLASGKRTLAKRTIIPNVRSFQEVLLTKLNSARKVAWR